MVDEVHFCPVCRSVGTRPLLALKESPIYLHPVNADCLVPHPHTMDLDYRQCLDCGHAFQIDYDVKMLSRIYRNHYYTPCAEGVGVGARVDFIEYLRQLSQQWERRPRRVLEVGCSSGDVLNEVRALLGLNFCDVQGVEPNCETATAARRLGLSVREEFFDLGLAIKLGTYDLVYSRHVVEHVDELEPFLRGLHQVADDQGVVILETPALDRCLRERMDAGFHVEHLHLFSMQSLAVAATSAGLTLINHFETPLGNQIGVFQAKGRPMALPKTDTDADLQSVRDRRRQWWQRELSSRSATLWGAGSAARILIGETGCEPTAICDGNPGKAGKKFVGLPFRIESAPGYIVGLVSAGADKRGVLVAASMFFSEIKEEVHRLGWRGDVIGLYDYKAAGL